MNSTCQAQSLLTVRPLRRFRAWRNYNALNRANRDSQICQLVVDAAYAAHLASTLPDGYRMEHSRGNAEADEYVLH